jgi:hypothetical protein
MVETDLNGMPEQNFSPLASPVDYDLYCSNVIEQWKSERDPGKVHEDAHNLLYLALRHPHFGPIERLQAFVFVTELTMDQFRALLPQIKGHPDSVKQAEMLHTIYTQVYAQSMVELAKLATPGLQPEGT